MKRLLVSLSVIGLLGFIVGCSDDDDGPTGPGGGSNISSDSTFFDSANGWFVSSVDGSDTAAGTFGTLDFSANTSSPMALAEDWDLKFRRQYINTNGGASADGGNIYTHDLGVVNYDSVDATDTAGISWAQDVFQHAINEWYVYGGPGNIVYTQYVYTLRDVEADNWIEFRVDSLVATSGGPPPSEYVAYISYFYNDTAQAKSLTGQTVVDSIEVSAANGYKGFYDFSEGMQITVGDAATSMEWDLYFDGLYEIFLNSGPTGPGEAAAFPMHGELTDPTSLSECTAHPPAPMFQDYIASVFNGDINDPAANWYDYNGQTHTLTSKSHVYLIKTADALYKMRIESYYKNIGGVPTSGYYTVIWNEL